MVRSTQATQRMLTSTPKAGSRPPQDLPRLPSTPAAPWTSISGRGDNTTIASKKRRRSSFYKTKSAKSPGTRKHRFRPGVRAIKEIRFYQKYWGTLIPKLPFSRLVHEIISHFNSQYRVQRLALEALQEAAEVYIVGLLERANLCSFHARRVTVMQSDMKLVRRITQD